MLFSLIQDLEKIVEELTNDLWARGCGLITQRTKEWLKIVQEEKKKQEKKGKEEPEEEEKSSLLVGLNDEIWTIIEHTLNEDKSAVYLETCLRKVDTQEQLKSKLNIQAQEEFYTLLSRRKGAIDIFREKFRDEGTGVLNTVFKKWDTSVKQWQKRFKREVRKILSKLHTLILAQIFSNFQKKATPLIKSQFCDTISYIEKWLTKTEEQRALSADENKSQDLLNEIRDKVDFHLSVVSDIPTPLDNCDKMPLPSFTGHCRPIGMLIDRALHESSINYSFNYFHSKQLTETDCLANLPMALSFSLYGEPKKYEPYYQRKIIRSLQRRLENKTLAESREWIKKYSPTKETLDDLNDAIPLYCCLFVLPKLLIWVPDKRHPYFLCDYDERRQTTYLTDEKLPQLKLHPSSSPDKCEWKFSVLHAREKRNTGNITLKEGTMGHSFERYFGEEFVGAKEIEIVSRYLYDERHFFAFRQLFRLVVLKKKESDTVSIRCHTEERSSQQAFFDEMARSLRPYRVLLKPQYYSKSGAKVYLHTRRIYIEFQDRSVFLFFSFFSFFSLFSFFLFFFFSFFLFFSSPIPPSEKLLVFFSFVFFFFCFFQSCCTC